MVPFCRRRRCTLLLVVRRLSSTAPKKKAFDRCGRLFRGGGFAPPAKNQGVWGAAPPSQKRKNLNYQETVFMEKPYQEKQLTVCSPRQGARSTTFDSMSYFIGDMLHLKPLHDNEFSSAHQMQHKLVLARWSQSQSSTQ